MKRIKELIAAIAAIITEAISTPRVDTEKLKELAENLKGENAALKSELEKLRTEEAEEDAIEVDVTSTLENLLRSAAAAKPPQENNLADVDAILGGNVPAPTTDQNGAPVPPPIKPGENSTILNDGNSEPKNPVKLDFVGTKEEVTGEGSDVTSKEDALTRDEEK